MREVEIVVVPRERYAPTLETLRHVVATVPHDVPVTLVRGGMPDRMATAARALYDGRVAVIGPARHLAPNAARHIGLTASSARFVVFVDNDVVTTPGWLEPLVDAATSTTAWVVRPLVLQRVAGAVSVHEAGGDCHLARHGATTTLVDLHRHQGRTLDEVGPLLAESVELFEFHTVLFDREKLLALGGPDEAMRSQGDHLDLVLRVHAAGGLVWFEPASRVVYLIPEHLAVRDLAFFLGRWSPAWNRASERAFFAKHGVNDLTDPYETWRYPDAHRAYAWLPIGRPVAKLVRRPIAGGVARRFDRFIGRHIAQVVQRAAPRWQGDGAAR